VSHYYYAEADFPDQPRLFKVLDLIVRARACAWTILGGFPDGKGFAVTRDKYQEVGGIELFYQVRDGEFVCHLSDDWDFGIKLRASGEELVFAPRSRVRINPRRIEEGLDDMLEGVAYGRNGIITMNDYRPLRPMAREDLSAAQAERLFANAIKDFTPKNIILPVLLTPELLERQPVLEFLGPELCARLAARIAEITAQMQIRNFLPIHRYKTPSYRLYLEFREELFQRMRLKIDPAIGTPPPLPECLERIRRRHPASFADFVHYYAEDRESGEAHNYFCNGGVF